MFWIGLVSGLLLFIGGVIFLSVVICCYIESPNDEYKKMMIQAGIAIILGVSILILVAWGDRQFDKTIEEAESLIDIYQLEVIQQEGESISIEKMGNTYLYTRQGSEQKVSRTSKNVKIIEQEQCTQPTVSVYETTTKSSAVPQLLLCMYCNSQHGSSTTIRYEITVPMGTTRVIAEDY